MPEPTRAMFRHAITLRQPFWRGAEIFSAHDCVFLLDSSLVPDPQARFSYLGGRPAALLIGRRTGSDDRALNLELTTWRAPDGHTHEPPLCEQFTGDPFVALRELNARYAAPVDVADRPPFTGGLVGYFGYETAHAIEELPDTDTDDLQPPDLAFMVADEVLVHDHTSGTTTLYMTGGGPGAAARAERRAAQWQSELAELAATTASGPAGAVPESKVRAHFGREEYMAAVQQCRQHIRQGDVFEVCLTHRLEMDLPGSAWDLYGSLRDITPAPFASFLQLPGFQVVGASPERFLKLSADGVAESRPMKGTRPRGATAQEDEQLARDLANNEKDLAENIMIVDLVRNDLGRVCQVGSVEVTALQVVETYATVHQLVSTVRGKLKPEHDALDLVRACFPGGSMTGAPKIAAMKIIDAIEPVKRGVYSGALGFIDSGGAMDLGMVIRTIVCRDGVATFGVGGAIVSDSAPAAEYNETMDKARALIAAVRQVNAGGRT